MVEINALNSILELRLNKHQFITITLFIDNVLYHYVFNKKSAAVGYILRKCVLIIIITNKYVIMENVRQFQMIPNWQEILLYVLISRVSQSWTGG